MNLDLSEGEGRAERREERREEERRGEHIQNET